MITAMELQPKSWPVRRGPRSWAWVVRKERFSLLSCWSWTKGYESLEFPYYWIKAYLRLESTQSRAGNWKVQIPLASCEFVDIAMREAKLPIHVLIKKLLHSFSMMPVWFGYSANCKHKKCDSARPPVIHLYWPLTLFSYSLPWIFQLVLNLSEATSKVIRSNFPLTTISSLPLLQLFPLQWFFDLIRTHWHLHKYLVFQISSFLSFSSFFMV